jgi:hypothetical protein
MVLKMILDGEISLHLYILINMNREVRDASRMFWRPRPQRRRVVSPAAPGRGVVQVPQARDGTADFAVTLTTGFLASWQGPPRFWSSGRRGAPGRSWRCASPALSSAGPGLQVVAEPQPAGDRPSERARRKAVRDFGLTMPVAVDPGFGSSASARCNPRALRRAGFSSGTPRWSRAFRTKRRRSRAAGLRTAPTVATGHARAQGPAGQPGRTFLRQGNRGRRAPVRIGWSDEPGRPANPLALLLEQAAGLPGRGALPSRNRSTPLMSWRRCWRTASTRPRFWTGPRSTPPSAALPDAPCPSGPATRL